MGLYEIPLIWMIGIPAASFLWMLFVGLFAKKNRWLLWIPPIVGVIGLVLCLFMPSMLSISKIMTVFLLYFVAGKVGFGISKL